MFLTNNNSTGAEGSGKSAPDPGSLGRGYPRTAALGFIETVRRGNSERAEGRRTTGAVLRAGYSKGKSGAENNDKRWGYSKGVPGAENNDDGEGDGDGDHEEGNDDGGDGGYKTGRT